MNAWQLPISSMRVAHYFHQSRRTGRLVKTACGRLVNPGFAIPWCKMKCVYCKRAA